MELFQTPDIQAYLDALVPRDHNDMQPIGNDASLRTLIPRPITKLTANRLAGQLEFLINFRVNGNVPRGRQTDFLYELDPTTLICGEFNSNLDTPRRRETIEKVANARLGISLSVAFRTSRILGVGMDALISGQALPGVCPHCGHAPDFDDEDTADQGAPETSGLSLVP